MSWWLLACTPAPAPIPEAVVTESARSRFDPHAASAWPPGAAGRRHPRRLDDGPTSDWGPPLTATHPPDPDHSWSLHALRGGRWALTTDGQDAGTHVFDPARGRVGTWPYTGELTPDGAWVFGPRTQPVRFHEIDVRGAHSVRLDHGWARAWSDATVAAIRAGGPMIRQSRRFELPADPRGALLVAGGTGLRFGQGRTVVLQRLDQPDDAGTVLGACLTPVQTWWAGDGSVLGCLTEEGFAIYGRTGRGAQTWSAADRSLHPVGASWSHDGARVVLYDDAGQVVTWEPASDREWRVALAPGTQAIVTDDGSLVVASLAGAFGVFAAEDGTRLDDPARDIAWAVPKPDSVASLDGAVWRRDRLAPDDRSASDRRCDAAPQHLRFGTPAMQVRTMSWRGPELTVADRTSALSVVPGGEWSAQPQSSTPTSIPTLTWRRDRWRLEADGHRLAIRPLPAGETGASSRHGETLAVASRDAWWVAVGDDVQQIGHQGASAVAVTAAGDRVAAVNRDGSVVAVDPASGAIQELAGPGVHRGAQHLAWSDDGTMLALGGQRGVVVWDRDGGVIAGLAADVGTHLAVDPEGCTVALLTGGRLSLWDAEDRDLVTIAEHLPGYRSMIVVGGEVELEATNSGRLRASRHSVVNTLLPWNILSIDELRVDDAGTASVLFQGQEWAVDATGRATIRGPAPAPVARPWTVSMSGRRARLSRLGRPDGEPITIEGVAAAAWEDGGPLHLSMTDGTWARWNQRTGLRRTPAALGGPAEAIAVAGGRIARAASKANVVVDAKDETLICVLPRGQSIALSPSGRFVAWLDDDVPVVADVDSCTMVHPAPPWPGRPLANADAYPLRLDCHNRPCELSRGRLGLGLEFPRDTKLHAQSRDGSWAVIGKRDNPRLWDVARRREGPALGVTRPLGISIADDGWVAWRAEGRAWWMDPREGVPRAYDGVAGPGAVAWHPSGMLVVAGHGELRLASRSELREAL